MSAPARTSARPHHLRVAHVRGDVERRLIGSIRDPVYVRPPASMSASTASTRPQYAAMNKGVCPDCVVTDC
eukprot:9314342-Pyramimonas_sp.AAC.1